MSGEPPLDRMLRPFPGSANPYPNFPQNAHVPPHQLSYPMGHIPPQNLSYLIGGQNNMHVPPQHLSYPTGGQPSAPPMGFVVPPQSGIQPPILTFPPHGMTRPSRPEHHTVAPAHFQKMASFRWVSASASDCSMQGLLLVGHDVDGSPIYAGRAYHNGDLIPAKVIPCKQVAYVAYGGEELIKDQFEVLIQPSIQWIHSSNGQVPMNAVPLGSTADGEPLYLGRVHHDGAITPGKIQPSHGCCYYPFAGEEKSSTDYEALVFE